MCRICVRKQLTDIAQRCRAQERVDHRVQQDIGVAVTGGVFVVRHRYSAQPQRPARLQPMRVMPDADAKMNVVQTKSSAVFIESSARTECQTCRNYSGDATCKQREPPKGLTFPQTEIAL